MVKMEPALFFAGPPNLDELCSITVKVQGSHGLCVMQPQVVRCREIIFTEPDIIATPVFDMEMCFNIVLQQSLFKTGRLQSRLQKQGMQISKPCRVHPGMYQSCLTYTLIARMSPYWNKAGEWMVQGRDFVSHEGYTNAVKISVNVNREEIYISLAGTAIRFLPLQVEDLNLSHFEMHAILQSTEGEPYPVELADSWCYVLPSMKRGRISSLSLVIPEESPFPSYKELKRHWKNMYGYRLPETDEDLLYCQVGFLASGGGKQFTYPTVCLRSNPVQVVQRVDPKPVLTAYLQDLHAKLGIVCGMPLRFQPKLRYAAPALHSSSQPPVRVNLSTKPLNKSTGPLRDNKDLALLYNSHGPQQNSIKKSLQASKDVSGSSDRIKNVGPEERALSDSSQLNWNGSKTDRDGSHCAEHVSKKASDFTSKHDVCRPYSSDDSKKQEIFKAGLEDTTSCMQENVCGRPPKVIPIFRPKVKFANTFKQPNTSVRCNKVMSDSECGSKIVPVFKSRKRLGPCSKITGIKQMAQAVRTSPHKETQSAVISSTAPDFFRVPSGDAMSNRNNHSKDVFSLKTVVPAQSPKLKVPQFPLSASKPKAQKPHLGNETHLKSPHIGSKVPKLKSPNNHNSRHEPGESHQQNHVTVSLTSPSSECSNLSSFSQKRGDPQTPNKGGNFNKQRMVSPFTITDLEAQLEDDDDFDCFIGTPTSNKIAEKRKQAMEDEHQVSTTPKKVRTKPQIQNIDVNSLAKAGQLSKVNTATLMAWLRERNISYKSKDKKTDLIEKVNTHLNITVVKA